MDFNRFRVEEKAVLEMYKKKIGKAIASDGLLCPEKYFSDSTKPKMLFVLQMPNMDKKKKIRDWSLLSHLRNNGGQWQTWGTLAKWIYAVVSNFSKIEKIDSRILNNRESMKEMLHCAAFININKHGAERGKDWRFIEYDYDTSYEISYLCKNELYTQICLYKPEVIVGCGTSIAVRQILDNAIDEETRKKLSNGYHHYRVSSSELDASMIEFHHPAYLYMGQNVSTQMFLDSVTEILDK